ncbi:MAG: Trm112 family protein [bacterium]|nr:Trm112 family protein [bacterium]
MLDPKLLEILACPQCRKAVVPDENHQWLYCNQCQVRFRVEGDIPIMLPDEAEKVPGTGETPAEG